VIRSADDERVLGDAGGVERVEDGPDPVVERAGTGVALLVAVIEDFTYYVSRKMVNVLPEVMNNTRYNPPK
jgi:hypothetical protein